MIEFARLGGLGVMILGLVATPVAGQTVRGTVVLGDSVTPVPGVVVLATNARGVTVGRTLAGRGGRFSITLPEAGSYSLRALRIGYRPTTVPAIAAARGDTVTVTIVFAGEAVMLTGMNVRDRETCRVSADTGLAVARVWEEARKAMLTSQLTADGAPLVAEWIEYDRMLDSTARLVRQQQVRSARHPTTHAFKSAPADALARDGYVTADNSGTTFYAPDAEVLLSDAFVSGHCFRLAPPPPGAGDLIGVAFQPTRDRRDKREIEGTLWLDRASAELRTLEFRYTNLPDVVAVTEPGGRVEFVRLADGNWLVSRWSLRMPKVAPRERSSDGGLRKVLVASSSIIVRGVQVTGGEVSRVMRGDSLLYRAAGPGVAIQLTSGDTLVPVRHATLTLEGTDYRAVADGSGVIRLSPVLAGRYRARVSTPLMDSLAIPPAERDVETHADARVDTIALPTGRDVVSHNCPRDSVSRGEGMLHGRVLDEGARPLALAAVVVKWQGDYVLVGGETDGHFGYREKMLGALTDDAGQWRVCGVPTSTRLSLRVETDSGSDVRIVRLADDQPFGAVDLVVRRVAQATRDMAKLNARPAEPMAFIEISVRDASGNAVAGADLDVLPARGAARAVATGPAGVALVPDVAPGLVTVRARHVGFAAGQVLARVDSGRNTLPIILGERAAPVLDTVRVVGGRGLNARFDAFETRRAAHATAASFTRDDIVKRNPTETWQILASTPSIRISDRANMVVAVSTRTMIAGFNNSVCYVQVMVDGIVMTKTGSDPSYDLRNLPRPEEIHGIEVFAGPATLPPEYAGIGDPTKFCGLIAIWTR